MTTGDAQRGDHNTDRAMSRPSKTDRRRLLVAVIAVVSLISGAWGVYASWSGVSDGGGTPYAAPACRPDIASSCTARSDVFPRLIGTRNLLLEGEDPYSDRLQRDMAAYLPPGSDLSGQLFFYPLPTAFLLAPFALLPDGVGGAAFVWFFAIAWLAAIVAILRLSSRGTFPWGFALAMCGLVVMAPAFGSASELQQPALLFAAVHAVTVAAMLARRWGVVGVLTAISLLKPQIAVLTAPVAILGLAVIDRSRRGLIGFGIAVVALFGASFVMVPSWISGFLGDIRYYRRFAATRSIVDLAGANPVLVSGLALMVTAAIAIGLWVQRESPDAPFALASAFCGIGALSLLTVPRISPLFGAYDHMPLFVAAALAIGLGLSRGGPWKALTAVGVFIPVSVYAVSNWLAEWPAGLRWANDFFARWDGLAIPPQLLFEWVVGQVYIQTVVPLIVVAVMLIAVIPRRKADPTRLSVHGDRDVRSPATPRL